jgi:peroxiredoxin
MAVAESALGTQVVGVSIDERASHKAFAEKSFLIDTQGLVQRVYERVDPDTHAAQVVEDLQALLAPKPPQ